MGGFAKKASQAGSKAVLRKQSAKKWHKRPAAYAASSPTTTTAPRRVIRNHEDKPTTVALQTRLVEDPKFRIVFHTYRRIWWFYHSILAKEGFPPGLVDEIPTVDGLIERTEMISGHVFKNKLLCAEALQTKPPDVLFRVAGAVHRVDKNQALSLVGDAALYAVLAKMFYQARDNRGKRHTLLSWNKMKPDLFSNMKLADRGFSLGLDRVIITSHAGPAGVSPNTVADVFEAIIGAIYMDAENNSSEAVAHALQHMGFFDHPLFAGTSVVQPIPPSLPDSSRYLFRKIGNTVPEKTSKPRGSLGSSKDKDNLESSRREVLESTLKRPDNIYDQSEGSRKAIRDELHGGSQPQQTQQTLQSRSSHEDVRRETYRDAGIGNIVTVTTITTTTTTTTTTTRPGGSTTVEQPPQEGTRKLH